MARDKETKQRLAAEHARRTRLGVPVAAAGVLYMLGAIIIYQALTRLPTVGLLQALAPALSGKASAVISPESAEIRFLSHQAFSLIAGSVLQAIGYAALTLLLVFLLEATEARSGESSSTVRTVVLVGGFGSAVMAVASQVVRAVSTHNFAVGHTFTQRAVEGAVSTGTANVTVGYLGLLLPVVLVVGMIIVLMRATRVGLITRWLRGLGIAAAVIILPIFAEAFTLQVVPTAWMVAMGFLFMSRLPNGDPPAWESGEAMPWPSGRGGGIQAGAVTAGNGQAGLSNALESDRNRGRSNGEVPEGQAGGALSGRSGGSRKRKRSRGS